MARFLVTEYAHSWVGSTLHVAVTTDVLSHLWLRHTDVIERVHIREKIIRGLSIMGDPKYCFVEWAEVEQNEVGDGLTHTFTFNTWAAGEQRWWHFRADVEGSPSQSNTNIFTAIFQEQGEADSLKHTDLINKEPAGIIDHADGSITGAKLEPGLEFGTFPTTPDADPDADLEVANKRYVDNAGGAGIWTPIETITFNTVTFVDFTAIPSGFKTLMLWGTFRYEVAGGALIFVTFNGDSALHYSYRVIALTGTYNTVTSVDVGRAEVARSSGLNEMIPWELRIANSPNTFTKRYFSKNSNSFSSLSMQTGEWHTSSGQINRVTLEHDKINGLSGSITLAGMI